MESVALRHRPLWSALFGLITLLGLAFVLARTTSANRKVSAGGAKGCEASLSTMVRLLEELIASLIRGHQSQPVGREDLFCLQRAQVYYQALLARDDPSPELRSRAHRVLGQISMDQNNLREAELNLLCAQTLLGQLSRGGLDDPISLRFSQAETANQLAYLGALNQDLPRARDLGTLAVQDLSELIRIDPRIEFGSELSLALLNLALICLNQGDEEEAAPLLESAISTLRDLGRSLPEEPVLLLRLIDVQQLLTGVYWNLGHREEARKQCLASLETLEQIRRDGQHTITLEFCLAERLARQNLEEVAGMAPGSATLRSNRQSPEQSPWTWRWNPLLSDGKTIPFHTLTKGHRQADFEQQEALLLSFSWSYDGWWRAIMAEVIRLVAGHIRLIVLVPDLVAQRKLEHDLRRDGVDPSTILFVHITSENPWIRDYGPVSIRTESGIQWIDAVYRLDANDRVPRTLAAELGVPRIRVPVSLEGGNLLWNGKGLGLSTTSLLEANRGLGHDDSLVNRTLQRLCGADEVIYLEPLEGTASNHVDWFAAFTAPNVVVIAEGDETDPVNREILDRNARRLSGLATACGPLKVVRIPMPPRIKGAPLATFTNVVFANGVLLVPDWSWVSETMRQSVKETYERLLPAWQIVMIESDALGNNRGSLRCATVNLDFPKDCDGLPFADWPSR